MLNDKSTGRIIFDLYKPFRNHIRQVGLYDSLQVLWCYILSLQFDKGIPSDIEVHKKFHSIRDKDQKRRYVSEWELETLAREIIINAQAENLGKETLKKWRYFAGAINKLRELEEDIFDVLGNSVNVLIELFRIAHRQFPWQMYNPTQKSMTRYFKIFNSKPIADIIQRIIGLTTRDLYLIGSVIFAFYLNKFALQYPPEIGIKEITKSNLNKFLKCFSCELTILKQKLLSEQEINEKFAYSYHSLRAYPIIKIEKGDKNWIICPFPTLLFWRLTSGVYYEICNTKDFDEAFGFSFQKYVGEVIEEGNTRVVLHPEEEYYVGKQRKDTVDWIADEADASLFIECKTKRMPVLPKSEIKSESELEEELEKMSGFVIQIYKGINDCVQDRYPSYKFKKDKTIFPMIVTLEDWFMFGDELPKRVRMKVKEKFAKLKLPLTWLNDMPYSICSVQDFEEVIQVMYQVGLKNFMSKKIFDIEKQKWSFISFINDEFKKERKNIRILFPDDYKSIFPEKLIKKFVRSS